MGVGADLHLVGKRLDFHYNAPLSSSAAHIPFTTPVGAKKIHDASGY